MRRDWKAARAKVDAEGFCRVCRWASGVQAAHVVPRSLGGKQKAESVVPLCAGCHDRYDGRRYPRLDLYPYLTKEEIEEANGVLGESRARRRLSGNPEGTP